MGSVLCLCIVFCVRVDASAFVCPIKELCLPSTRSESIETVGGTCRWLHEVLFETRSAAVL